jgi:hypothetical protein
MPRPREQRPARLPGGAHAAPGPGLRRRSGGTVCAPPWRSVLPPATALACATRQLRRGAPPHCCFRHAAPGACTEGTPPRWSGPRREHHRTPVTLRVCGHGARPGEGNPPAGAPPRHCVCPGRGRPLGGPPPVGAGTHGTGPHATALCSSGRRCPSEGRKHPPDAPPRHCVCPGRGRPLGGPPPVGAGAHGTGPHATALCSSGRRCPAEGRKHPPGAPPRHYACPGRGRPQATHLRRSEPGRTIQDRTPGLSVPQGGAARPRGENTPRAHHRATVSVPVGVARWTDLRRLEPGRTIQDRTPRLSVPSGRRCPSEGRKHPPGAPPRHYACPGRGGPQTAPVPVTGTLRGTRPRAGARHSFVRGRRGGNDAPPRWRD